MLPPTLTSYAPGRCSASPACAKPLRRRQGAQAPKLRRSRSCGGQAKLKGQSSTRDKQIFCPQCRTEYREGFYTCTDCGASLVPELPPELTPEYLEFEEILISLSGSDTAMIKSLLNSEGITYYFRGESSYSFAPPTRLMVQKDRADEAREILDGLTVSEDITPDGSGSDDGE